jgi:DNA-binding MarR family transcriptional regulator
MSKAARSSRILVAPGRPRRAPAAAKGGLEFREFISELFAAAAGMQSLRRAIARSVDLGGTELAILLAIWRLGEPGSIGIKGLAGHLHVAGPHITDEVARLVRIGYLDKSVDPEDSRAIRLTLSKSGQSALESLAPVLDQVNRRLFEGLTAKEMRTLRLLFQRLIERSASSIEQVRSRRAGRLAIRPKLGL